MNHRNAEKSNVMEVKCTEKYISYFEQQKPFVPVHPCTQIACYWLSGSSFSIHSKYFHIFHWCHRKPSLKGK